MSKATNKELSEKLTFNKNFSPVELALLKHVFNIALKTNKTNTDQSLKLIKKAFKEHRNNQAIIKLLPFTNYISLNFKDVFISEDNFRTLVLSNNIGLKKSHPNIIK